MSYFDIAAILTPLLAMFLPSRYGKIAVFLPVGYFAVKYAKDSYLSLPPLDPKQRQDFEKEYADLL